MKIKIYNHIKVKENTKLRRFKMDKVVMKKFTRNAKLHQEDKSY
jgi:hypothetical protein